MEGYLRRGAPAYGERPAPKKISFYRRMEAPFSASGSAAVASGGAVTGTGTGAGTGAAEYAGLCAGAGSSRGIPRKERRFGGRRSLKSAP